ncbi:MAG: phosphoglycerate kinase [Candidatus Aminicenantes bacterium]|nr:phosphoglycerate kinase [Candidatus Aminicenantes bacterium]NIM79218.1 phosphoglycerate kinase [Candidatus Aminicenantes bacterium]NIN18496.1 phosphoglycerate kinase [Candidatus Aminicenantes bacterium]NIN42392.1 phosphoglycerate kinase [Candidatus Aminicenantes bacterium]NIN85159.1 phosphoglycerate kinase [Candidatus Aminicenantes bacterium]
MKKISLSEMSVKGKRVFVRVDFNVPLNEKQEVTDDTRIKASLPTLRYLVDEGAKILCASHLGRPKGEKKPEFSLKPVAERLSQLLNREVKFAGETIGPEVESLKAQLKDGDILLLENLRFNPGETENDEQFAKELARNIDIYINDAFGASHRAHASIQKITEFVPVAGAGFLLKKEIDFLNMATENPPKNYTVLLGGAKVSDKIPVITNLLEKAQKILIGGAMAHTFLRAKGFDVGNSIVEDDFIAVCKDIIKKAEEKNIKLLLPIDHVAAIKIEPEVTIRMIKKGKDIPENMMGLDIGFETIELYCQELKDAELIVWNGPMGVFEIENFAAGTMEIAKAVAESSATTIIGGGDSVSAINKAGVADKVTHISTGGGASLEFLSGKKLPGIESLSEA